MSQVTALNARHRKAGARMVDFGGWDMPLHYGSQLDEHHAVRRHAGVFDVSHMTVVDASGSDAESWLRQLLANDIARRAEPGQGLYSCMLNDQGGVIDDLITYRRSADAFRVVVNAATRDKDLAWMRAQSAGRDVILAERRDAVMLAVQGPQARALAGPLLPGSLQAAASQLQSFQAVEADGVFVARTGYTGEDGYELVFDDSAAGSAVWDALIESGSMACGLGARDTLRLEAGLPLYGQDLDEQHSPLVSGLGWTVTWEPDERDFNGRRALLSERAAGLKLHSVGLLLEDRGIIRAGQRVLTAAGDGLVTSGGFSPTLERSIALARIPVDSGAEVEVEIRAARRRARVVKPRFVRNGQSLTDL